MSAGCIARGNMDPANAAVKRGAWAPRRRCVILRDPMARRSLAVSLMLFALAPSACSDRPPPPGGSVPAARFDAGPIDAAPPPDLGLPAEDARPIVDGYPAGPYGFRVGDVFPDAVLDGYPDASDTWTKVFVRDLFDHDGSRGIHGVLVVIAAEWCGECNREAKWLPRAYADNYQAKGARFLTAVIHDRDRKPATKLVADRWRDTWGITFAVAIDPTLSLLPKEGGPLPLPYSYVIDPRTMRVTNVLTTEQVEPTVPALDALLAKNGG